MGDCPDCLIYSWNKGVFSSLQTEPKFHRWLACRYDTIATVFPTGFAFSVTISFLLRLYQLWSHSFSDMQVEMPCNCAARIFTSASPRPSLSSPSPLDHLPPLMYRQTDIEYGLLTVLTKIVPLRLLGLTPELEGLAAIMSVARSEATRSQFRHLVPCNH